MSELEETPEDNVAEDVPTVNDDITSAVDAALRFLHNDLLAIAGDEEYPVIVITVVDDQIYAQVQGTMEQVKVMTAFVVRQARIQELEAELAALRG